MSKLTKRLRRSAWGLSLAAISLTGCASTQRWMAAWKGGAQTESDIGVARTMKAQTVPAGTVARAGAAPGGATALAYPPQYPGQQAGYQASDGGATAPVASSHKCRDGR